MTLSNLSHEPTEDQLLDELLAIRRAIARTLGREQYLYRLVDTAIETGHAPSLRRAWREINHQPNDIQDRILSNHRPT